MVFNPPVTSLINPVKFFFSLLKNKVRETLDSRICTLYEDYLATWREDVFQTLIGVTKVDLDKIKERNVNELE